MSRATESTSCCIVGGGPAGIVLGYLLARAGIPVTVLEARRDFDRSFRGDAVFSWILELLDELGLAEEVLALPHSKVRGYTYQTDEGSVLVTDYSQLRSRFPYVAVIPQDRLLGLIAAKASQFPHFRLHLRAPVKQLLTEDHAVRGVVYERGGVAREVRAALTVGADGRFSRIRKLSGLPVSKTYAPHFDVLWFRLPRRPDDYQDHNQRTLFGRGFFVSFIDRTDTWQVAYTIPKGSFPKLRESGLPAFRNSISTLAPMFASRMEAITSWTQIRILAVEMSQARRWYRPGLLLIGDAAHVMSSIGGVGITCAMQDAVEAANAIAMPLRQGAVSARELASVQRRRQIPTRAMQLLQFLVERQYVRRAFDRRRRFTVPRSFRLPGMHRLTAHVTAYGVWPVRLSEIWRA